MTISTNATISHSSAQPLHPVKAASEARGASIPLGATIQRSGNAPAAFPARNAVDVAISHLTKIASMDCGESSDVGISSHVALPVVTLSKAWQQNQARLAQAEYPKLIQGIGTYRAKERNDVSKFPLKAAKEVSADLAEAYDAHGDSGVAHRIDLRTRVASSTWMGQHLARSELLIETSRDQLRNLQAPSAASRTQNYSAIKADFIAFRDRMQSLFSNEGVSQDHKQRFQVMMDKLERRCLWKRGYIAHLISFLPEGNRRNVDAANLLSQLNKVADDLASAVNRAAQVRRTH